MDVTKVLATTAAYYMKSYNKAIVSGVSMAVAQQMQRCMNMFHLCFESICVKFALIVDFGVYQEQLTLLGEYNFFQKSFKSLLDDKACAEQHVECKIDHGHLLRIMNRTEEARAMYRSEIPWVDSKACVASPTTKAHFLSDAVECIYFDHYFHPYYIENVSKRKLRFRSIIYM